MSNLNENPPRNGEGDRLETVEGPVEADLSLYNSSSARPGPSVASRHLPVPGRI